MLWKKIDMVTVKRKKLCLHKVKSHRKPCWGKGLPGKDCLVVQLMVPSSFCCLEGGLWRRKVHGEGEDVRNFLCELAPSCAGSWATPLLPGMHRCAQAVVPNSCWAPQTVLGASSGPGKSLPVPLMAAATCGVLLPFLVHPCVFLHWGQGQCPGSFL